MNKNAIQKFAIWARKELIAQVSQRAYQYGIDESGFGDASADTLNGRLLTAEEKSQRQELIKQIQEKGYKQVMEEVAYTWFNRFIALRFMEVNNYLPSHIRVFSDSTGAFKPEILSDVLHLELPGLSREKVAEYIESNDTEGLYRYLLLTQCNALNEALPRMFEEMGGYTELLLPNNILKQDSVLGHMVADIPEEDWQNAVQIIGWLYQYYNTELKDDTFALLKKNVKITKERIPSATQLFTPDWIVRYMVENSLGRLWLEGHPNAELHDGWKYYLDEAEQEPEVEAQLAKLREEYTTIKPEDIKVIDPCMGSGHILVYAFDVLMQIYEASGYSQRDAAQSILENNLFGLDIDDRAAQLAYFAVMMKARQYDRRIFSRGIQPHVYAIVESNGLDSSSVEYFTNNDPQLKKDFGTLIDELRDAKEYGSILNISQVDFASLYARVEKVRADISMFRESVLNSFLPLIQVAEVMAKKYDVVVTNPPYMAVSNAGAKVNDYVKKNFPDSKSDMFAVFIERCGQMAKKNGYQAMITQHAWMFLSSFEKLRTKLLAVDIVNMVHLGARAFEEIGGEVVQTTSFVIRKSHIADYKGEYCRLIEPTSQQGKEDMFLAGENRYATDQSNFSKIPGKPIAYWASKEMLEAFDNKILYDVARPRQGMATTNNDLFLRLWHEISFSAMGVGCTSQENALETQRKWFPVTKGGTFRRWYGNFDYVVNYENSGKTICDYIDNTPGVKVKSNGRVINRELYFHEGMTWSTIASGPFGMRYVPNGFIFETKGSMCFTSKELLYYLLGLYNTSVIQSFLQMVSPTLDYHEGPLGKTPVIIKQSEEIDQIVRENITLSHNDWDSYETSWDFMRNPLV